MQVYLEARLLKEQWKTYNEKFYDIFKGKQTKKKNFISKWVYSKGNTQCETFQVRTPTHFNIHTCFYFSSKIFFLMRDAPARRQQTLAKRFPLGMKV